MGIVQFFKDTLAYHDEGRTVHQLSLHDGQITLFFELFSDASEETRVKFRALMLIVLQEAEAIGLEIDGANFSVPPTFDDMEEIEL